MSIDSEKTLNRSFNLVLYSKTTYTKKDESNRDRAISHFKN